MSARRYRRGKVTFSAKSLIILILIALLALVRSFVDEPGPPPALEEGIYRVERAVDGDTLLLTNQVRIRLLGADTPETVHPKKPVEPWGPEASDFTHSLVDGREVRLQFDRERVDHYGRFLAYVWINDDQMLNEELLRAGLAKFLPQYPYSSAMKRRFRQAEQEAKDARRGIWSE